jgi:hypothetical protein
MARITGIGSVFFKSRSDSVALATWYQKHLGLQLESFGGAILKWPDDKARTKASPCGTSRRKRASGSVRATLLSCGSWIRTETR